MNSVRLKVHRWVSAALAAQVLWVGVAAAQLSVRTNSVVVTEVTV